MTGNTTVVIRPQAGIQCAAASPSQLLSDRPPSRTMTPHAQSYLAPYVGGGACTVGAAAANSSSLRPESGG